MKKYTLENYDFDNDDEFQAYLQEKLPKPGDAWIRKDTFIRIIIKCKKEWIKRLNYPWIYV